MFGHRDDVIRQDQKRDADVPLPDDAFDLLTNPPAQNSQTDNPQPASSTPQYNGSQSKNPPLLATSVDGFSAPAANLTDPMNYSVTPASPSSYAAAPANDDSQSDFSQQDESRHNPEVDSDHPEIAMEPIELSHNETEHDDYLNNLTETPSVDEVNARVNEELAALQDNPHSDVADSDSSEADNTEENVTDDQPVDDTTDETSDSPAQDTEPETSADDSKESSNRIEDFAPVTDDLSELKQAALAELSPLVDRLSLEPEERFKTLMMLVQASDNQALLPQAHAAARQITDEKTRAEALLDIVNEINYFTKEAA